MCSRHHCKYAKGLQNQEVHDTKQRTGEATIQAQVKLQLPKLPGPTFGNIWKYSDLQMSLSVRNLQKPEPLQQSWMGIPTNRMKFNQIP